MIFQKIDQESADSITSALDFFNIPPTNTSISSSTWREYLTLNPVTDVPYRFKIYSSNNFLDLSKVFLLCEMRIRKQNDAHNWVAIENADAVGTINFIGSTFIRNIKVSLNGREISDSNSLYMYKSYLDAELSLPLSTKNAYLTCAGYYEDNEGQEDAANPGWVKRRNRLLAGRTAQFITKLDVDIFNQANYMVSGVEIDIEITPNSTEFCILEPANSAEVYKLEIRGLRLYVKNLELMNSLAYDISQKLEKKPARYAIRRTATKAPYISENCTEFNSLLFSEQIPRRIVLGIVSNDRYNGSKTTSPFKFMPFNVREISLHANGKNYPPNFYNINYAAGQYARPFHEAMEALGFANSSESNGISYEKYCNGWCLYIFNLTNSGEDSNCFDLISEGSVSVNIKFGNQVPAPGAVLICLAEFDGIIFIDGNKRVTTDYSA